MTNEEMNTALYKKMFAEQEAFKNELLAQTPAEVLRHAYEYTIREDILLSLEYNDLTDKQCQALLDSKTPLEDILHDFEQIEGDHMETVRLCIENRANDLIAEKREERLKTPIYLENGTYAREHNELPVFRASNKANVECATAIGDAIHENYSDNRLNSAAVLEQVTADFGSERVRFILANTVRQQDWDGRYSSENKKWAATVSIPENKDAFGDDRNRSFVIHNAHPGLIDLVVTRARKDELQEKTQDRKPSVLDKLQKPPAVGLDAVKKKSEAVL